MPPFIKGLERHHLIPKHSGGTDADGIVYLTKEEHAEIHWRLWCKHQHLGDAAAVNFIMERKVIDTSGENNSFYGKKHTPKTLKKMSEIKKKYYKDNPDKKPIGKKNGMYGKTHTEENKEKFRQRALTSQNNLLYYTDENGDRVRRSFKGKNNPRFGAKLTDETKANISKALKGKYVGEKHPNFGKPSPLKGKKSGLIHTEESKRIIGEKAKKRLSNKENHPMYGKSMSDEAKRNMSKAQKKRFVNKENHPTYGKTMKEVTGNPNWVSPRKGILHSDETKRKISETKKKRFAAKKVKAAGKATLEGLFRKKK